MALVDVSKTITLFQRLCKFAEEFTEEHRAAMADALTNLFLADLEEGQEAPDILELINSLVRRLRRTLAAMMLAETVLLAAIKENATFVSRRDRLTVELRDVFDRARVECRNHFTRPKSDSAGFPARMADDPGALLRQTNLVSWTLRQPDFELGESLVPGSTTTKESILNIYEPKVRELEDTLSNATRRRAKARGKQVKKNQEMADFSTTYSIFVGLIRGAFRLAGQKELANRLTLKQIGTPTPSPRSTDDEPPADDVPTDPTSPAVPPSADPAGVPADSGQPA